MLFNGDFALNRAKAASSLETDRWTEGRNGGRLEIHPLCPTGPKKKKKEEVTKSRMQGKPGG